MNPIFPWALAGGAVSGLDDDHGSEDVGDHLLFRYVYWSST